MTLDSDTEHFPPSPPRKSYNPFDSDDDTLDSPGLKPDNVYTKEDHTGFDLKALDKSAVDAQNLCMKNGDLSWEEAVFGQPVVNSSANGHHTSLFEKDGQLYMDKNVTECELPEIVVCYKDNYQSVKDIGIDEGVPIHDKIWVQSYEDEIKDSSSLLALIGKGDDVMNTEKCCPEVDVVESPKSKLNEEVVNGQNLAHEFRDEDCLKINEAKLGSEDQASFPADWATTTGETDPKNESKQGEPDLIGENGPDHDDTIEKKGNNVSPDEVGNAVVQEPTVKETPSKLSTECSEATAEPDKSPNEEKNLPNSSKDVEVQESANTSTKDESENVEAAKPPSVQSMTRQEEATSTNSLVFSLEPRNHHGETSFSSNVSVPLPSSITFTGPVAYSGNISYRSESSAGSTRSFAFPILQTEWNSSPERMVKADQRHLRKQKGWVQALICCRF